MARENNSTLNLAIGPSCPVRCEGCYNFFGESSPKNQLITADEVLSFAEHARDFDGYKQATVSGGDPLSYCEIVPLLKGLKGLSYRVQIDTVGSAFLGRQRIIYQGTRGIASARGEAPGVDINGIAASSDLISLPLDGASDKTINYFRKGRANLLSETRAIASLLHKAGVNLGVNTVLHRQNIHELNDMRRIVTELGASVWQIFEYDASGPNPSSKKADLELAYGSKQFMQATQELESTDSLRIESKSLSSRTGIYTMIDPFGIAWQQVKWSGEHFPIGHIFNNMGVVLHEMRTYPD